MEACGWHHAADILNGPLYELLHSDQLTPPALMALRGQVPNWLQLLVQTAHCGWLLHKHVFPPRCREWGVFAEPRGELLVARDAGRRGLSASGVGSEVDFDVRDGFWLWMHHVMGWLNVKFVQSWAAVYRLQQLREHCWAGWEQQKLLHGPWEPGNSSSDFLKLIIK